MQISVRRRLGRGRAGDSAWGRPRPTETPKRGGTLTYMIPADAPPSFDGTARRPTRRSIRPRRSTASLIRVNPDDPRRPTDFVCDLCTEMPQPTDDGKTYTFKIREGVKFHDGSPLTAADVAASWNKIIFPPEGVTERAPEQFRDGRQGRGARPDDRRLPSQIRDRARSCRRSPTRMPSSTTRRSSTRTRTGTRRTSSARARSNSSSTRPASRSRASATPITITRACPISTASSASSPTSRRPGSRRSARPRRDRVPRLAARGARRAGQGARRQDHGADQRLELRRRDHPEPQEKAVRRRARAPRPDPGDRPLGQRADAVQDRDREHGRRRRLPRLAAGRDQGGAAADRRLLARHREVAGRGAAAAEGGRGRGAELRAAQPQCRPALQVLRHLG